MSDFGPDDDRPDPDEADRDDVEAILGDLIAIVEHAKSMPLSSSAMIARDEVLAMLEAAREALPVELQRARRVLRDLEDLHVRAEREAAELLDEARARSAYMVQRTEVVRQARHQADRIIEDAGAEGRKIRHEADDYVDRKLAAFEIVLDRTMRTVQAGRARLMVLPEIEDEPDASAAATSGGARPEEGFFDQDER